MSVRDYKRAPRTTLSIDGSQLRGFALGLALGLAVAAVVYIGDHRVRAAGAAAAAATAGAAATAAARPTPQQRAPDDLGLPPIQTRQSPQAQPAQHARQARQPTPTVGRFDFYQMLPRARVLVATHDHVSHVAAASSVEQPGDYLLQIGSYRDGAVAERVRAQAARMGISAAVERVTVGSEVWHRVRVGPLHDLSALNRIRQQLQTAGLNSLVVRLKN